MKIGLDFLGDRVVATIPSEVAARRSSRYADASRVTHMVAGRLGINISNGSHVVSETHPCSHGLLAVSQGLVPPEHASSYLAGLRVALSSSPARLIAGPPEVFQQAWALPLGETRGEPMDLLERSSLDLQQAVDETWAIAEHALGSDWEKFVGIVKGVSFVSLPRQPAATRFSGSTTDVFGSIHVADQPAGMLLLESMVHEAAHLWLFLVEDVAPLARNAWEGSAVVSPWRTDVRPVGGVVHGAFVFSCVAAALSGLASRGTGVESSKARQRLGRVVAEAECAASIIRASGLLTGLGQVLVDGIEQRLMSAAVVASSDQLATERIAVTALLKSRSTRQESI